MMQSQNCLPAVPAEHQFELVTKELVTGFAHTCEYKVVIELAESFGNDVITVEWHPHRTAIDARRDFLRVRDRRATHSSIVWLRAACLQAAGTSSRLLSRR